MFAIIESGAVTQYPANPYADNPDTSFGEGWQGGVVNGREYVRVASGTQPPYDADTQTCVAGQPELIDGVWTQSWTVRDLTEEEIEAKLQAMRAGMRATKRQAILALDAAGMLEDLDAALAAAPALVQRVWEATAIVERTDPMLAQMQPVLGWTDEQLDDLFLAAAQL